MLEMGGMVEPERYGKRPHLLAKFLKRRSDSQAYFIHPITWGCKKRIDEIDVRRPASEVAIMLSP